MKSFTKAEIEAETALLRAQNDARKAIDEARPEPGPPPNRKIRDQADTRIIATVEGLKLQTRRPTWGRTLVSLAAMSVGLVGVAAVVIVARLHSPAPAWVVAVFLVVFAAGFFGAASHSPNGSPKSWHTRNVAPEVLEDVIRSRRPYGPSPRDLEFDTTRFPMRIWLVPESDRARLRAMAESRVSQ